MLQSLYSRRVWLITLVRLSIGLSILLWVINLSDLRYLTGFRQPPRSNDLSGSQIHYYPQTGHTIQDPFLTYYLQIDGVNRLGYPITEALDHEGWRVQYFQFGRLEIHPENHPDYFITVGWLGQWSHRTRPAPLKRLSKEGRYFAQSGYTLQGDFLTYYDHHGGSVQFGYPIGSPFLHQGRIVQDLQSARFIWYPELPIHGRVQLEPLGEIYFLNSHLSLDYLEPVQPPPEATIVQIDSRPASRSNMMELVTINETTSRPEITRFIVKVFDQNNPIEDYQLWLAWENQPRQPLPLTRASGQTHILVKTNLISDSRFKLYDSQKNLRLLK